MYPKSTPRVLENYYKTIKIIPKVAKKYSKSINKKLPQNYLNRIPRTSQKYPKSIQKVLRKYPKSIFF